MLMKYPVNVSLEEQAMKEYKGFMEYNSTLQKAKETAISNRLELQKKQEEQKALELKRKAPGLSESILQPTKSESLSNLSESKVCQLDARNSEICRNLNHLVVEMLKRNQAGMIYKC
jgi:trehalose-6-phosphate synthase